MNDIPVDEMGWTMLEFHLSAILRMRRDGTFNIRRQQALHYIKNEAIQFLCKISPVNVSITEFTQLFIWHQRLLTIHVITDQILAGLVMDATKTLA